MLALGQLIRADLIQVRHTFIICVICIDVVQLEFSLKVLNMLLTFGIIINVIWFCLFKLFHLNVLEMLLNVGVWHPHLIIIRNIYDPNYSSSFKFVIVLDVSAKNVSYFFQ